MVVAVVADVAAEAAADADAIAAVVAPWVAADAPATAGALAVSEGGSAVGVSATDTVAEDPGPGKDADSPAQRT
ncbi:hypothetical protein CDN98_05895 [Roseateles terrae]|nr:hypothetical protein CDN98_05895 [Roseateles terrae]